MTDHRVLHVRPIFINTIFYQLIAATTIKFQVEIGVATEILILKLYVNINLWFSTLNYATTIQVQRLSGA